MSIWDNQYYLDLNCVDCNEVKMTLERHGIRFVIINVTGAPEFENRTPMLQLKDGTMLEGKEAIYQWLSINR